MAAQALPPPLLALFAPRPPLQYLPPFEKNKLPPYSGIAAYVTEFEDPSTVDYSQFTSMETRKEKQERIQKLRAEKHAKILEQALQNCIAFCFLAVYRL